MDFEWDERKELANQKNHGVSFLEASEVLTDELSSFVRNPDHSDEEERFLLFGVSLKGNFFVVSFTERAETIRRISARPMARQELNGYER